MKILLAGYPVFYLGDGGEGRLRGGKERSCLGSDVHVRTTLIDVENVTDNLVANVELEIILLKETAEIFVGGLIRGRSGGSGSGGRVQGAQGSTTTQRDILHGAADTERSLSRRLRQERGNAGACGGGGLGACRTVEGCRSGSTGDGRHGCCKIVGRVVGTKAGTQISDPKTATSPARIIFRPWTIGR